MRTWLVTGGAGFIGANLVHHVLTHRPDIRVVAYDALTYAGHRISLRACEGSPRFAFVHADVCNTTALEAAMAAHRPEVVFHLAAESHVDRSIHGPAPFLRTNVEGTFQVLEAARRAPGIRVVVVGTDEVYGSREEGSAFREEDPLVPSSPYSASKAAADLLALAYHRTYGLDVVVTRCSNNYGPYQLPEKLVPLMILAAVEDRPLPLYGDGRHVRDWVHVEDHCAGLLLAAERGAAGRVYNFGGECERTNLDVVRAILARLGKPESLIRHVADRPGHDRRYAMDISRAREELGFVPRIAFEQGLAATVDWYLAHRDWCEAVRTPSHEAHLARTYDPRLAEPA
jgi:dTDP-glucose 4,6-dehydratase